MAPSKNTAREVREARERLRRYNARQAVHTQQVQRRKRDNVIAVIGVVVVVALATLTQVFYFTGGPGMPAPLPSSSASATPTPTSSATPTATPTAEANVGAIPSPSAAENRTWTGDLTLNKVALGISLDGAAAPQAVASFVTDTKSGYYKGKTCHRLTTGEGLKVLQCGSLTGDGQGDTTYSFGPVENAPGDGVYPVGTIALARGESQYSQDHQFFIVYGDTTLATDGGGYTVIGKVTSGLDQLQSQIISGGVAASSTTATDGPPAIATTITAASVK